ncbi:MAG: hypothetical protein VB013_10045 [Anaerolineaceae bacterium]|nr:hypothetical protein [Anaerolineaceae bacterium]
MDHIFDTILVLAVFLLPVLLGYLLIRHYFDILKSGQSITISKSHPMEYGKGMEVGFLKGKQAKKDARTYLIYGIVILSFSLPILLLVVYKILVNLF